MHILLFHIVEDNISHMPFMNILLISYKVSIIFLRTDWYFWIEEQDSYTPDLKAGASPPRQITFSGAANIWPSQTQANWRKLCHIMGSNSICKWMEPWWEKNFRVLFEFFALVLSKTAVGTKFSSRELYQTRMELQRRSFNGSFGRKRDGYKLKCYGYGVDLGGQSISFFNIKGKRALGTGEMVARTHDQWNQPFIDQWGKNLNWMLSCFSL